MKFSIRFADQIVGTLVVLALVVLIFVVFMLGKSQRWFVKDYEFVTYLNSASGLSRNMAVQYKGFSIGRVKKYDLAEDDRVEVSFTIFEDHIHRVKVGSIVELQASPIGLGNSFLFYPGKGEELLLEGSTIPEIHSSQGKLVIAMGLADKPDSGDSINNIINQVTMLLETINYSLSGEDPGSPSLAQIVIGINDIVRTLSGQLSPIMGNLESFTASEGPLVTDLTSGISSLALIIENLEKTSDFIPAQLPQVAVLISDLNVMLRAAQDVLTAVANNPLLRGGIPQRTESGPGGTSSRNLEF